MGGLTSILGGLVLLAIAVWFYISGGGFSASTLALLVGAAVLFLRGAQGRSLTQAGDVTAPMDFVANPADAIVDAVVERFTNASGNSWPAYIEFGHDTTIDLALAGLGLAK